MKIDYIYLKNFKQYGNCEIEFPDGLIGFVGANGAGKSTIFEAVLYVLFGEAGIKKEDLRNNLLPEKSTEPVEVHLHFTDKGREYKVERALKGKTLVPKAALYGDNIQIAEGAREVNKYIRKILKMDSKSFAASFFSRQKDVTALLEAKDSDREKLLRKMLGLEKLDIIEEKMGEKITDINRDIKLISGKLLTEDEITGVQAEIAAIHEVITNAEKKLGTAQKDYKEKQKLLTGAKSALEEYREIEKKHTAIVKDISAKTGETEKNKDRIKAKLNDLEALNADEKKLPERKKQSEAFGAVSAEVEALRELKRKAEKKHDLEEQRDKDLKKKAAAEENIKSAEKEIHAKGDVFKTLGEKKSILAEMETNIANNNRLKDELLEEHSAVKSKRNDAAGRQEKIEKIGKDAPCPECERPLAEHYDFLLNEYKEKIASLDEKLKSIVEQGNGIRKVLDELEKKKNDIGKEILSAEKDLTWLTERQKSIESNKQAVAELTAAIEPLEKELELLKGIAFDEAKLAERIAELKKLEPLHTEYIQTEERVKQIPAVKKELQDLETDNQTIAGIIAALEKEKTALKYSEEEMTGRQAKVESIEAEKEVLNTVINQLNSEIAAEKSNATIKSQRLIEDKDHREQIAERQKESDLHSKIKSLVNDFKKKVTSRELPAISKEASDMFTQITMGRYTDMQIKDDFALVTFQDGKEFALHTLSGGEKDLASLCLRIAISKRVSSLAGREKMGFLALDEVFGSQDEARREGLINALNFISGDFNQIFVVSHNADVQEKFDKRLMIKKEGMYSTAKMMAA